MAKRPSVWAEKRPLFNEDKFNEDKLLHLKQAAHRKPASRKVSSEGRGESFSRYLVATRAARA
jgi:hypothetical protein